MAAPTYKFSQFVDLLLVKLYEVDQTSDAEFVDLENLAREIKGDVPSSWVFDAGKVFQTRMLADVIFTFGGTHAKITGEGRLYVEEGRGFTKTVQESPSNFYINVSGDHSQIVAGSTATQITQTASSAPSSAIAKALDEAVNTLKKDASISDEQREEALSYIEVVRQQIKKPEPNRSVLSAVLEPLSKITTIAGYISTLIKYFNAAA